MLRNRKYPHIISVALDTETANWLEEMAMRRLTSRCQIIRELIRKEAKLLNVNEEEGKKELSLEVCSTLLREVSIEDKLKALVQESLKQRYAKIECHEDGYVFKFEPILFAFIQKFNVEHQTNYVIEYVYNTLVKLIRVVNANVKAKIAIPLC
jgi:phosphopantothenoylcysteine synthetase/decarboxylase